ncbi:MAG: radical SAM family heme chaperone HemW [Gemmataceae bacterium]
MSVSPSAAYVHIPFCAHHCGYCDFAVTAGQDRLIDMYLEALSLEIGQPESLPRRLTTLFLGGGTPSHLNLRQLDRLFGDLDRWLPRAAGAEVSLEANPDSFDADKAKLLAQRGVTRISLGVQSFQSHLLRVLERRHDPGHVAPAITAARDNGLALSLDLIFGVPGQTFDEWASDLQHAVELRPDHISTYGLTFETGTRLWKQRRGGELTSLDEDLEYRMYRHAMEALEKAGFEQYEISSFARPGMRCRHNQVYWANGPFWGFGVGAAAYVSGTRTLNVRNTQEYIRRLFAGESPVFQSETLTPEERARETLTLNLRRDDGIDREQFREQTGFDVDELARAALRRHTEAGLINDDGRRLRLTRAGRCVADSVVTDLL